MQTIKPLLSLFNLFSAREKWLFAWLIPLLLVGSSLEVVGVSIIPAFLAAAISPESFVKVPLIGQSLADLGMRDPMLLLRVGAIAVITVFILKNIFHVVQKYIIIRFCTGRRVVLGARLFRAYQQAPMEELLMQNTATVVRNINSDVKMIGDNVLMSIAEIIANSITCAGVLLILFLADYRIGLVMVAFAAIVGLLYLFFLNPKSAAVGKMAMNARLDLVRELNESLNSIRETRVMHLEAFQVRRLDKALKVTAKANVVQGTLGALATPLLESLAVVAILGFVLYLVSDPSDLLKISPLLTLVAFSLVRMRGYVSILFSRWNALSFHMPSVRTVVGDIIEFERKGKERLSDSPIEFSFKDKWVINDLDYEYPQSKEPLFKGVNLTIQKGETVAIVGTTGSGKTTLVDLMLGILRPSRGSVTLDGVEVNEIYSLRSHVGYVPQFIYLYDDTILNNVCLGMKASKIDDDQVWQALEGAQLADLVRDHPDQLNWRIGENGGRLSGGQRQRLGMARALYSNPEILVLDEGTSALDNETEKTLMDVVINLQNKVTTILVAHRLETIRNATRIIELSNGRIVGSDQRRSN